MLVRDKRAFFYTGHEKHFLLIDAMYSDRQYRKQMDFEKVLSIIREVSGTQLNPEVVDAFFRLVDKGEIRAVEARETAGNESLPD